MIRQRLVLLFLVVLSLKMTAQSPQWSATGMPMYGWQVRCIYTDTLNDALYVTGGIIASQTDYSNYYICKYNGSGWSIIGAFDNQILSLATYNGDLIAAGFFNTINGVPIFSIARYDGSTWHPVGNFDVEVANLKVINSDLYAMGYFNSVDGIPAKRIAKWNGSVWSDVDEFSVDTMDGHITDVEIYKGNTYVCGNFTNSALGINHLAVYKGGTWQNVGGGILGGWTDLAKMAIYKNELYVAGQILKPDGNTGHMIQKWDDTEWSEVGESVQDLSGGYGFCAIRDLLVYNNELYVAGGFGYAGHVPATFIAKWDGLKWCGFDTKVLFTAGTGAQGGEAVGFYKDTLYLGIGNDTLNGVATNRIIKYTAGNYNDTCSIEFTGINQLFIENNISLYPNPSANQITLELSELLTQSTTVVIKNTLAQTIKTFFLPKGNKQLEIDVSDLPKGLYFVQLQSADKIITKKFIKE